MMASEKTRHTQLRPLKPFSSRSKLSTSIQNQVSPDH